MSSVSKKILLIIFVVTAFYAHLRMQPYINPAAALHISVNRDQAKEIAGDAVGIKGKADVQFDVDEDARIYLEREMGLQRANSVAQQYGFIYNWNVIYPDGTSIYIDPEGRLNGCDFSDNRSPSVANGVNKYLEEKLQIKLADYSIMATPVQMDSHRPVKYQWERDNGKTGNAREVITAVVCDGSLQKFRRSLHVPEYFKDIQGNQEQMGDALTMLAQSLFAIPYLAAAWAIVLAWRRRELRWRVAILPAVLVTVIAIVNQLNMVLLLNYARPNIIELVITIVTITAQSFISTMLLVAAGDWLYRQAFPDHPSMGAWFRLGGITAPGGKLRVGIGYALFAFHLGYVSIFYGIAHRFGGWSPALVPYNDLFNSQTPWIYALLVGVHAAVFEEFLFRVVAISWLRKVLKNDIIAVIIPALMWAFAHCNYAAQPFYIRGVELTVIGVIFGLIFLRFGPLPTLISHAAFNAFLTAESFLSDKSMLPSFFIVIFFIAIPALLTLLPHKKDAKIRLNRQIASADVPTPEPEEVNIPYQTSRKWLIVSAIMFMLIVILAVVNFPVNKAELENYSSKNYPNRTEIIRIAEDTASKQGAVVDGWTQFVAVSSEKRTNEKDYHGYTKGVCDDIRLRLDNPPELWVVGWIKPATGERWTVRILPDGKVWDVRLKTKDDADGAFVTAKQAEDIALNALIKLGLPKKNLLMQSVEQENLPNRNSYKITWSYYKQIVQPHFESIIRTEVDGGRMNGINRELLVPDNGERPKPPIFMILAIVIFIVMLIITALRVKKLTRMEVRVMAYSGILLLVSWVINVAMRMPQLIKDTPPNISVIAYKFTTGSQFITGGIIAIALLLFALYAILAGRRSGGASNQITLKSLRDAIFLLPISLPAIAMLVVPIICYIKWKVDYLDPGYKSALILWMPTDISALPANSSLEVINAFITTMPGLAMIISALMIAGISWVISELPVAFVKVTRFPIWAIIIVIGIAIALLLPVTHSGNYHDALISVSLIVAIVTAGYLLLTRMSRQNILIIPMAVFVAVILHQAVVMMQF
jgi:membrane protease YdiL (CAAX protease family)